MKNIRILFLGLVALVFSVTAKADVLVLVHGYLGSASSWEQSGVNAVLETSGWSRAGVLLAGPQGVQVVPVSAGDSDNKAYTVELPSMAPMMVQANYLQAMLQAVSTRHPGEPVILAAHSAGGVVARVVLVRGGVANAKALITIASPHLGTLRAVQALDATDSSGPFGFVKNIFGGDTYHVVKDSWGALVDLTPPYPGSLLYWLNIQQHPDIAYHAVVRTGPVGMGDELVPVYSQDLNNVPALQGKAQVVAVNTGHVLNPQDGVVLAEILKQL
jgi:pimeloyl-ACP methyl ester carboxylesterase